MSLIVIIITKYITFCEYIPQNISMCNNNNENYVKQKLNFQKR